MEGGQEGPTRILMGVNQSSLKGYPHPSISSKNAFDWTIKKLIRSRDNQDFKLQILHVQIPDERVAMAVAMAWDINFIFLILYYDVILPHVD